MPDYVGTNLARVQEALKSFYLDGLRYQLNDKASAFLAQIEKTSENVVGKDIVMALRYGRTGGIGNRADDGLRFSGGVPQNDYLIRRIVSGRSHDMDVEAAQKRSRRVQQRR